VVAKTVDASSYLFHLWVTLVKATLKCDETFSGVCGYFITQGDRNWCLVARYIRIVEVSDSNPLCSTSSMIVRTNCSLWAMGSDYSLYWQGRTCSVAQVTTGQVKEVKINDQWGAKKVAPLAPWNVGRHSAHAGVVYGGSL